MVREEDEYVKNKWLWRNNIFREITDGWLLHITEVFNCLKTSQEHPLHPLPNYTIYLLPKFIFISIYAERRTVLSKLITNAMTFIDAMLLSKWQRISSVQSLDRVGHWGDITDDSGEILIQSFLQEAIVSSSSIGRDVHSLTLSIKHFLCQPQCCPPSKVPWRMVLKRLS